MESEPGLCTASTCIIPHLQLCLRKNNLIGARQRPGAVTTHIALKRRIGSNTNGWGGADHFWPWLGCTRSGATHEINLASYVVTVSWQVNTVSLTVRRVDLATKLPCVIRDFCSRYPASFQIRLGLFVFPMSRLCLTRICGVPTWKSCPCLLLVLIQCLIAVLTRFSPLFFGRYPTKSRKISSEFDHSVSLFFSSFSSFPPPTFFAHPVAKILIRKRDEYDTNLTKLNLQTQVDSLRSEVLNHRGVYQWCVCMGGVIEFKWSSWNITLTNTIHQYTFYVWQSWRWWMSFWNMMYGKKNYSSSFTPLQQPRSVTPCLEYLLNLKQQVGEQL